MGEWGEAGRDDPGLGFVKGVDFEGEVVERPALDEILPRTGLVTDRVDERIALLERTRDRLDGCIGCGCLSLETCALYNPGDRAARAGPGPRFLLGDRAADFA